jgi:hypothetical protein
MTMKKTLMASFAAAVLAVSLAAAPAEARNGRNAALAVGVLGALAVGGLLANEYHHPGYYPAYNPGYAESDCYWEKRPVTDYWGNVVGFKRARICN